MRHSRLLIVGFDDVLDAAAESEQVRAPLIEVATREDEVAEHTLVHVRDLVLPCGKLDEDFSHQCQFLRLSEFTLLKLLELLLLLLPDVLVLDARVHLGMQQFRRVQYLFPIEAVALHQLHGLELIVYEVKELLSDIFKQIWVCRIFFVELAERFMLQHGHDLVRFSAWATLHYAFDLLLPVSSLTPVNFFFLVRLML